MATEYGTLPLANVYCDNKEDGEVQQKAEIGAEEVSVSVEE